jgi:hypothetical protein
MNNPDKRFVESPINNKTAAIEQIELMKQEALAKGGTTTTKLNGLIKYVENGTLPPETALSRAKQIVENADDTSM